MSLLHLLYLIPTQVFLQSMPPTLWRRCLQKSSPKLGTLRINWIKLQVIQEIRMHRKKYSLVSSVSKSLQKHPSLSYLLVARALFAASIVFSSGSPVPLCVPTAGVLLLLIHALFSRSSNPCSSLLK